MKRSILFFMLMTAVSLYGYGQQTDTGGTVQLLAGQWSVEKATDWYAKQQWIVGCNFLPSTAVNDVEMWQDETFDLPTIDRELGMAKEWGINSVRVFLNYVVWEAEAKKLKSNFKKFLAVAEKHGISVMPVLFDDCNFSGNVATVGKQQEPVPGVILSSWVSSPPLAMVRDEAQWEKLKAYEQDMIRTFRKDKRIIIWDLYNEPGNNKSEIKPQLVQNIFAWAREVKPAQPLTIGAWLNFDSELSRLFRSSSDIVSFHAYDKKDGVEKKINWTYETGRPVVCTEWLLRQGKNTPEVILPLFKSSRIGAYSWGLAAGRTQTYCNWGKKDPEPEIWQHDLIRRDGTPYSQQELEFYKQITGGIKPANAGKGNPEQTVYMFSYFKGNGEDGLHLAFSKDCYKWESLNHDSTFLKPELSKDRLMRDPCIIKGGDGLFHMVWTVSWSDRGIGYASSGDLIHWSEQKYIPVMTHRDGVRNCWAPEITYDGANGEYMIYWSSTVNGQYPDEAGQYGHRIYYVTSKDFSTFSETKLLFDPGYTVIDANIARAGRRWIMFYKDERNQPLKKTLNIAYAKKLRGPYTAEPQPITQTDKYLAEGPSVVKVNDWWIVYFDKFNEGKYGAIRSKDLKTWEDISSMISLPKGARHGTIFKVTESFFEASGISNYK